MKKLNYLVIGREARYIGDREHTAFKRKFKTPQQALTVGEEVQKHISDIYGRSYTTVYEWDADLESWEEIEQFTDYDATKSPDLGQFDVKRFLASKNLL